MDPAVIVLGFGVGLMIGMTGMGGGSLMTPLLILVFGVKPVVAVGTDISYAAITKTVGGWRHLRLRTVKLGLALWLALGSVPGAIVGVRMIGVFKARYGDQVNEIILAMLAGSLLIVGTAVLIRAVFMTKSTNGERKKIELDTRHKVAAIGIGAVTGFVIGITSVGSGTLVAILLIAFYRLAPRQVVGTDVFHAAILLWAAGAAHGLSGNVDFALMAAILAGSLPGVWVGSHLSVKLPEGFLRTALGVVLLASGLTLLDRAGLSMPAPVLIAVPVALVVAIGAHHIVRNLRKKRAEPEAAQVPPVIGVADLTGQPQAAEGTPAADMAHLTASPMANPSPPSTNGNRRTPERV